MNIYEDLLRGIFSAKAIAIEQDKESYLRSLQKKVKSLREAYQKDLVEFDYRDLANQAAYLLAYFPHYTDLLLHVLDASGSSLASENVDSLVLFGGGPCPEVIGYLRYLQKHSQKSKKLTYAVFDNAVSDWKWSRDVVWKHVLPHFLHGATIKRRSLQMDFTKRWPIRPPAGKHLCVFQNCLNEIKEADHDAVIGSICKFFDQLSAGSYLAFIEQTDYEPAKQLTRNIEQELQKSHPSSFNCNISRQQVKKRTSQDNEPQIIFDNLLRKPPSMEIRVPETDKVFLARRQLNFTYSLIKKEG